MGRSSAPGLHARPALLIAVGVALMFARIWGPSGEDATRLAFVVLLAATLGNLLVAIVVVHKASTEIVENPTDTVVGEPAGVEMSISGLRSAVSVRMRSSPDVPWVTALPPDVGFLPGSAELSRCRHTCRGRGLLVGTARPSRLLALAADRLATHAVDRASPGRAQRADRPRASHRPFAHRASRRRG